MARKWMVDLRERMGLAMEEMAQRCECSHGLLYMVESGSLTHHNIAARIARAYGMDVHQYNQLVADEHKARVLPRPKPKPVDHGLSIYSYGGMV